MLTWEELGARSLAAQFPVRQDSPGEVLDRVGPMQTQTARSAFLGLAARAPGLTHAEITAAYETTSIVRGSTLRGTVHTATAGQHRILDAVTRVGQRALWARTLRLSTVTLEEVWASIEAYAAEDWRTPDELFGHLTSWLSERGESEGFARLQNQAGRYFSFGHGGLVRRPLSGAWSGQGASGYRSAEALLGLPLPVTAEAVRAAVSGHVRWHGPSSRHDIAWWSGLGLRAVDAALASLEVVAEEGPDGRTYLAHPSAPAPVAFTGVRLLPEFDALLCGYDPRARDRFVTPAHHRTLWTATNGQMLAPMLVDGRIGGFWRAGGSAVRRPLEVAWFAGSRRPRTSELADAVTALEAGLGIDVTEVTVARA